MAVGRDWRQAGQRTNLATYRSRGFPPGIGGYRAGNELRRLEDSSRSYSATPALLDTAIPFVLPGAGSVRWTGRYAWRTADSVWAEGRWISTDPYGSVPVEALLPRGAIDRPGVLRTFMPRMWRIPVYDELALESGVLRSIKPLLLVGPLQRLVPVAFSNEAPVEFDDDGNPIRPTGPVLKHRSHGLLTFVDAHGTKAVASIDASGPFRVVPYARELKILSRENGVTFSVDPVEANSSRIPALPDSEWREKFSPRSGSGVPEWTAGEPGSRRLVRNSTAGHAFLDVFVTAWNEHRPVRLSPDAVWMLLLEGMVASVREQPEIARKEMVLHDSGKVRLMAQLPESFPLRMGQRRAWEEVARQLLDSMDRHTVGHRQHRLQVRFSTTTPTRALSVAFRTLDLYQDYFDYWGGVSCGIPSIHLEGTSRDWKTLRSRARDLHISTTNAWLDGVAPILDEFVAASEGHPSGTFWPAFVRFKLADPDCGEVDQVDGWITALFHPERPSWMSEEDFTAIHAGVIPPRLRLDRVQSDHGQSPFHLLVAGEVRDFQFVSGFSGVRQDRDGALSPELGWAVWEGADDRADESPELGDPPTVGGE